MICLLYTSILPYNAEMGGEILYCGEPLTEKRICALRGKEIVMVPQSTSYLDPLMKVGTQICKGKKDPERKKKLDGIFRRYGLAEKVQEQYPFELSGGMTRRVMISTAMIEEPKLVIADEPTPGLHLKAAKRAMEHFRELADMGAGVLIITHDLELALETADRVLVFYAGYTLEDAKTEDFRQEKTLRHPYTKALWRAMPQNGFHYIDGVQPYVKDMPEGCPFAPRLSLIHILYRGKSSVLSFIGRNRGWMYRYISGRNTAAETGIPSYADGFPDARGVF